VAVNRSCDDTQPPGQVACPQPVNISRRGESVPVEAIMKSLNLDLEARSGLHQEVDCIGNPEAATVYRSQSQLVRDDSP
jgi:hypothetical protein